MEPYKETQYFAIWVYAMMVAVAVFAIVSYFPILFREEAAEEFAALMAMTLSLLLALPLVLNMLYLTVETSSEQIYVHFGLLFPMMWKRISLSSIAETRVVSYRPVRDAGGWGYRLGKFEGRRCWYFNARGNQGVYILTCDEKRYVIGSQAPEALRTAIDARRGALSEG